MIIVTLDRSRLNFLISELEVTACSTIRKTLPTIPQLNVVIFLAPRVRLIWLTFIIINNNNIMRT